MLVPRKVNLPFTPTKIGLDSREKLRLEPCRSPLLAASQAGDVIDVIGEWMDDTTR